METQHPVWLAQRPSLGHQLIEIQLSQDPAWRPGRGQRPMRIRCFQEIGLESAGQRGVPQWSIPGPSCAHSIPDCRPITIRNADLTRTTLNSGVYINRPSQASSRIQSTDFVETPSPDLKLGAEKCAFATKEVSNLGHRVTEEGLLPDSALLVAQNRHRSPLLPWSR